MADKIKIPVELEFGASDLVLKAVKNYAESIAKVFKSQLQAAGFTKGSFQFSTPKIRLPVNVAEVTEAGDILETVRKKSFRVGGTVDLGQDRPERSEELRELRRQQKKEIRRIRSRQESLQEQEEMRQEFRRTVREGRKLAMESGERFRVRPLSEGEKQRDVREALPEAKEALSRLKKRIAEKKAEAINKRNAGIARQLDEAKNEYLSVVQDEAIALSKETKVPFKPIKTSRLVANESILRARVSALKKRAKFNKDLVKKQEDAAKLQERYDDLLSTYQGEAVSKQLDFVPPTKTGNIETDLNSLRRQGNNMRRFSRNAAMRKAKKAALFKEDLDKKYVMPALMSEITELSKTLGVSAPAIIGDTFQEQLASAKAMRKQMQQAANKKQKALEERQDKIRHRLMSSASIGIGLLGSSGMPLLNVAFAAWSGTPATAAIAGVATAVGETARAFNRLSEASKDAASKLNFIGKSATRAENRNQAYLALADVSRQIADRFYYTQQEDTMKRYSHGMRTQTWAWETGKGVIGHTFYKEVSRLFEHPIKSIFELPFTGTRGMWEGIKYIYKSYRFEKDNRVKMLEESLTAARSALPSVGIENDPFQVWQRMQNAALQVGQTEAERLLQETVRHLEELVRIEKEQLGGKGRMKGIVPDWMPYIPEAW